MKDAAGHPDHEASPVDSKGEQPPESPWTTEQDAASWLPDEQELVIGLVGAVGTDLELVESAVKEALRGVDYTPEAIRLSQLLHDLKKWKDLPEQEYYDIYLKKHMDAGTQIRELAGRGDAMALLAMARVSRKRRHLKSSQPPANRRAYVLRSIKHPKEIQTLRSVYGSSFVLVAAYSPRQARVQHLARRIANSHSAFQVDEWVNVAYELIVKDEAEVGKPLGQNVRKAFPMADVFVDASDPVEMRESVERFIQLLFGYPFHTPTRDEYAMFHAKAAALRSASPARQVGAAVATADGDIIAVGTNEVPKAGGGEYWAGDRPDRRDFQWGYDTSDRYKKFLITDALTRLLTGGWLAEGKTEQDIATLVDRVLEGERSPLTGAHITHVIEFVRAVHAEMSALVDAARRGASVRECTLYTTTFPCHDCAKHIVAAGIGRVVYIEPYPKSLAMELYPDSIDLEGSSSSCDHVRFQPFVGVAPRRYMELFEWEDRKRKDGTIIPWDRLSARPRVAEEPWGKMAHLAAEKEEITTSLREMVAHELLEMVDEEVEDA